MGLAYNNSKICNMLQYLDKAKGENVCKKNIC